MNEPTKDLGVSWRAIEQAQEELKDLKKSEEDIKIRRTQMKNHLEEIIKKAEEALKEI